MQRQSDYYAYFGMLVTVVCWLFSIFASGSNHTNSQIDNKRCSMNIRTMIRLRCHAVPCTILCLNMHTFCKFDCTFKAIIRKWKILTHNKAFCLNQLIIRTRFSLNVCVCSRVCTRETASIFTHFPIIHSYAHRIKSRGKLLLHCNLFNSIYYQKIHVDSI